MRAFQAKLKARQEAQRARAAATDAQAGMNSVTTMNFVLACFFGVMYEQVRKNTHGWFQRLAYEDKAVQTVVEQSRHIMKASDFAMEVARERSNK